MSEDKNFYSLIDGSSNLKAAIEKAAPLLEEGRTDQEWKEIFKKSKYRAILRRLRFQFWNLFNSHISHGKTIYPASIYKGVCSKFVFDRLMKEEENVAYVFSQPSDIKNIQKTLLYEGYAQLEDILEMDNVIPGIPALKLSIVKMLEDRTEGSVVQRAHTIKEETTPQSIEELRAEIAQIKGSSVSLIE